MGGLLFIFGLIAVYGIVAALWSDLENKKIGLENADKDTESVF